ncbi:glycerate kinase [Yimella sp. cx-573]|nr:glycerate kinase [Yimella sp. cx-573]
MPRVVIAPDKFKGTLTAAQVAQALERGMRSVITDLDVAIVPVADGGDGTLAAAEHAGFEAVHLEASNPVGRRIGTRYVRRGTDAVIEMAEVSGLAMLGDALDPMNASSRGLGEVLAAALDAGRRKIVVGIGGSASTDGGAGMAEALGVRILDAGGSAVLAGGAGLTEAASLDLSGLHPGLADAELLIACDVDNPLTGARGAAAVYGPQKGASADQVDALDAALVHWADLVAEATGDDRREEAGAGAAGGVGFAALALLGASLRPGAGLLFEMVGLEQSLPGADLVITGEGALDEQTLHGKAPAAVAELAAAHGLPVVAVCGVNKLDEEGLHRLGVQRAYAVMDHARDMDEAMNNGAALLERIGASLARDFLAQH